MKEIIEIETQLRRATKEANAKLKEIKALKDSAADAERRIQTAASAASAAMGGLLDEELLGGFMRKPYALIPRGKQKALVVVPKFVKDFEVGWLWKELDAYYVYEVDQYSMWLGEVPQDIQDQLDIKEDFHAIVDGMQIEFPEEEEEVVKRALKGHITDIDGGKARIIRGHAFDVLAEIIKAGSLPFKPMPVREADLRDTTEITDFMLRPYQQEAFDEFLATGAVGAFFPTGAGKSFLAMECMASVKGQKLIVVPTRTLVDQWEYYLETHCPSIRNEVRVVTYQGYRVSQDDDYALVIFDEVHRLPAQSFSRLATINTKYRLGLSASPHREDGREAYVIALSGKPVGLNWRKYMEETGRVYHPVVVHTTRGVGDKIGKIEKLLKPGRRTLIFCDGIDFGKRIANHLGVPHVHGETSDRLTVVQENLVTVVSRVMDMGASIKDLAHIIEVDFLMGSRQQQIQRTGRLMHSTELDLRHDIVFTAGELKSYGKRLYALQDKGFHLEFANEA